MEIVVTGGAGFIGSHLVEALIARGDSVTVVDDLSTGNPAHLRHLSGSDRLRLVIGNAASAATCESSIARADVVYHLAAAVGVRLVLERPVQTIQTNVEATRTVLELAGRTATPVFLASTSEVYGKSTDLPLREDQPLIIGPPDVGRWRYACSKALCEFLALAYWTTHGLRVTIGRIFNTVGPRQSSAYGMVLPTFVRQALHGKPITVYGDGEQTRCFVHVRDVVAALTRLMDANDGAGEIYNVGADCEVSIMELALRVKELAASTSNVVTIPYRSAYSGGFEDMRRRVPDLSKIRCAIDYSPDADLDEVIESVIAYERDRMHFGRQLPAGEVTSTPQ